MVTYIHAMKSRRNALTTAHQSCASFVVCIAAAVAVLSLFILLVHA
jgi:hypothetical protein